MNNALIVFDVENNSLHEEPIAWGGALLLRRPDGALAVVAPIAVSLDRLEERHCNEWVRQNVLPVLETDPEIARVSNRTRMMDAFVGWLEATTEVAQSFGCDRKNILLCADWMHPVETGFLRATAQADPLHREALDKHAPIHEIASWLRAARMPEDLPRTEAARELLRDRDSDIFESMKLGRVHHPTCDAICSGVVAMAALSAR